MTTLIPLGSPFAMEPDIVYAVPARTVKMISDDVVEFSVGTSFAAFGTVSSNTPTTIPGGGFARATNTTTNVIFSAF